MTVRAVEHFTNAQLLTSLAQGIDDLTERKPQVRTRASDPYRVNFFAEQIRARMDEDTSGEIPAVRTKMAKVVNAVADLPPALREDDKQVAAAIQKTGVFGRPPEDKWTKTAQSLPALRS